MLIRRLIEVLGGVCWPEVVGGWLIGWTRLDMFFFGDSDIHIDECWRSRGKCW